MLITTTFLAWGIACLLTNVHALPSPKGYLINCGSTEDLQNNNLKYSSDKSYISTGNATSIKTPNTVPLLSTLRYFPDKSVSRHCYSFPSIKGSKHLIRTTYFYGGFDGGNSPPIFDQFVGGSRWSTVNTSVDYEARRSSYYELVVATREDNIAVCLGRTEQTGPNKSPFISALEVMWLDDLVYKPVDFDKFMLSTVARHSFGFPSEPLLSFPDDNFNRYWQPYNNSNPIVYCKSNVTSSDFWNLPPAKVFSSAITTSRGKSVTLDWPSLPLTAGKYYVALYFQDNRSPSPYSWRVFNVTLNSILFYSKLNVSAKGVQVYANEWPLLGRNQIVLTPDSSSPVGPVVNAGEMLQMLPVGARTNLRDVMALQDLIKSIRNLPTDWVGDPCLPQQYSWTGVNCSTDPLNANVTSLNLTGMSLAGFLPPSIANLSDITNLYLANNKLTGRIPDMGFMKSLRYLHLENNQFQGAVPESLGKLPNIKEIYLQGNNLEPNLPQTLRNLKGIKIRT